MLLIDVGGGCTTKAEVGLVNDEDGQLGGAVREGEPGEDDIIVLKFGSAARGGELGHEGPGRVGDRCMLGTELIVCGGCILVVELFGYC